MDVAGSKPVVLEGMDFKSIPDTLDAIERVQYVEYRPLNQVSAQSPIDIVIPGSGDYIDLSRSMLHVKFKIVRSDGTAMTDTDYVSMVNLSLESMFNQVEVYLNSTLVSPSVNLFPYCAMIDTLFKYGINTKATRLKSLGYYHDTARYADTNNPDNTFNQGLKSRYGLISESKQCSFYGPILADVLQVKKWLVGGVDVHIRLTPSTPEFFLIKPDTVTSNFKLELKDLYYHVCKITPQPRVLLAQNAALAHKAIKYAYDRERTQTFSLPKDSSFLNEEHLFNYEVPTKIIVAHVATEAYLGSYKRNPFYVQNCEVTSIALYLNDYSLPSQPMRLDFANSDYLQAFYNIYTGFDIDLQDRDVTITPEEFFHAYAYFVFDLKAGFGQNYLQLINKGNLRLEINYKKPLSEGMV